MELFRCTAHSFFLLFLYYHETSGTVRAQNGRIRARSNPVRRNLNERIIRWGIIEGMEQIKSLQQYDERAEMNYTMYY